MVVLPNEAPMYQKHNEDVGGCICLVGRRLTAAADEAVVKFY
jgi:hypothetical protein